MPGLSKQEAPLTRTGRLLQKEEPKYLTASLAQGHVHFSSGCDFMMGLGKPKLRTKFKVASFSHCVNIEGEPQILRSSPSPGPPSLFYLGVIL